MLGAPLSTESVRFSWLRVGALLAATLLACGGAAGLGGEAGPKRRPTVHLVSAIDVKDFGAETLRIGDLDGDGGPDLLLVQSIRATREITCLTAITIFGRVLWQTGNPSADNGFIYSDLPVQIYDWDNDGANEVLYVRQAKYVEPPHDGRSPTHS